MKTARKLNTENYKDNIKINVLDYGADKSGFTDSTEAIIRAHSTGNKVYYPNGIYRFNGENLDLSGGVEFESKDWILIRNDISENPVLVFDDFGNLVGLRHNHLESYHPDSDEKMTSGNLVPPPISESEYKLRADLMVHFYNDFGKESTRVIPGWKGWYNWAWNYHSAGLDREEEKFKYHAERDPLLGFYRGDDPVVLDWICYWLAEYGVKVVLITASDLYNWEEPTVQDHWVYQLFKNAPNFKKLSYGVGMPGWFRDEYFPGEPEPIEKTTAVLIDMWDRVLESTYLSEEYKNIYTMNISGKEYPVLFMFEEMYLYYMLDRTADMKNSVKFLCDIADKFKMHGFPGYALIIRQRKGHITKVMEKELAEQGVYIFTGFYEQGFIGEKGMVAGMTYPEIVSDITFPKYFDGRIAHVFTGCHTLGPHPSCWNFPGNNPEDFYKLLMKAADYAERDDGKRIITCYNVSEWSEGGPGLQPNMKDDFG